MTDLAGATADTSKLTPYKGRQVVRTTVSIRNAGDGLSEGMSIDPMELDQGSTVYVVLECKVDDHVHKPLTEAPNLLELKQVLRAGAATIVHRDLVEAHIAEQRERIQLARDEAEGKRRLTDDKGDDPGTIHVGPEGPAWDAEPKVVSEWVHGQNVEDIKNWLDSWSAQPDRQVIAASKALEAEENGRNRKALVRYVAKLATPGTGDGDGDGE